VAVRSGVLDRAEARRERRAVLQRLERVQLPDQLYTKSGHKGPPDAVASQASSNASAVAKQPPSAHATSKPVNPTAELKAPAAKSHHLTAESFSIGDKVETKSGKKGVVTHIHGKAGYLFIQDQRQDATDTGVGTPRHSSLP
jgi:hypothetical protein